MIGRMLSGSWPPAATNIVEREPFVDLVTAAHRSWKRGEISFWSASPSWAERLVKRGLAAELAAVATIVVVTTTR